MGLPAEKQRMTVEEYLRRERDLVDKHEFHNGEILAMAGGTYEHSLITANVTRELGNALKGKPCTVLESNLRVRSSRSALYVYPDVSVICGPPQFDPDDAARQTVLNPKVVVEVLSSSTEAYDRGEKFTAYRELDSLQEYILVAQDRASVETYFRQADGTWVFTPFSELKGIARVRCLAIDLPLAEVYAGVEFGAQRGAGEVA